MEKLEILLLGNDKHEADCLVEVLAQNYITHIARSAEEALSLYQSNSIDLALLNVSVDFIPEGLKVAEFINESTSGKECPIIFLINTQDRTFLDKPEMFSFAIFLLKPFNELELEYSIELAFEKAVENSANHAWDSLNGAVSIKNRFLIKQRGLLIKVQHSQIIYIEADGRYSSIKTDSGDFLIQSSLSELLVSLDQTSFVKIHRNYVVNLTRIKEYMPEEHTVVMDNDQNVFVSRRLKEAFHTIYLSMKE